MIADRLRRCPRVARDTSSVALLLIGLLALCNWVLVPHVGYLRALQRLESAVARGSEERDRIGGSLEDQVAQWRSLQRETAGLAERLFQAREAQTFVRDLLPFVEETGCVVVLADYAGGGPAEPVPEGFPDAVSCVGGPEPNAPVALVVSHLDLTAAGTLDQITALLERIENHHPRVWVDACRFDFPHGYSGRMECHLVLTMYVAQQR
ncbi:MAG: hypothetical protein MUC88_08335 [Planctomycetes bacterium]|nr:hypothetical protein [Planctomycetota bacterium]